MGRVVGSKDHCIMAYLGEAGPYQIKLAEKIELNLIM